MADGTTASPPERLARNLASFAGSTHALFIGAGLVGLWLLASPLLLDWAAVYRLLDQITSGVMFLMIFVLQRSQNKDTLALHIKLDELIASSPRASNRVLHIEEIPEAELLRIRRHFELLDELSRRAGTANPLSDAEAHRRHAEEQARLAGEADQGSSNRRR